jgi:periplasmic copper chaperone A
MHRRLLLLAPLSLALVRAASAHSYKLGPIEIGHPWARPSVTGKAAIFVALNNTGRTSDRLTGGSTPVAKEVILRAEDGSPLEYLDLMPHHPIALRPGRKYIALLGLNGFLSLEDSFPLTLSFENAGNITVTVLVEDGPDH